MIKKEMTMPAAHISAFDKYNFLVNGEVCYSYLHMLFFTCLIYYLDIG